MSKKKRKRKQQQHFNFKSQNLIFTKEKNHTIFHRFPGEAKAKKKQKLDFPNILFYEFFFSQHFSIRYYWKVFRFSHSPGEDSKITQKIALQMKIFLTFSVSLFTVFEGEKDKEEKKNSAGEVIDTISIELSI